MNPIKSSCPKKTVNGFRKGTTPTTFKYSCNYTFVPSLLHRPSRGREGLLPTVCACLNALDIFPFIYLYTLTFFYAKIINIQIKKGDKLFPPLMAAILASLDVSFIGKVYFLSTPECPLRIASEIPRLWRLKT